MLLFANQLSKPVSLKEIVDTVYKQVLNNQISIEQIIKSNQRIDRMMSKY